jgi:uncharacterized protein Yka (UPF0111/DUF47 family)
MEQILAFGLGIMLVSTIVLVYVVLKSAKQVSKCVENIREIEQRIDNLQRDLNDREYDFHRNIDETNRKVDSRVDKLHDILVRDLQDVERRMVALKKTVSNEY